MTPKTPARMVVVKKEDKELKLRQLVLDGLAAISPSDVAASTPVVLRIVALSSTSPVIRAVATLQDALAQRGIVARVIVAKADQQHVLNLGLPSIVRHLSDVRCHDAHELLILGPSTTWIGDCMRRDPAVRDSYELHCVGCAETARLVTLSFDKLWQMSLVCETTDDRAALALAADLAGLPSEAGTATTALTRH